MVLLTRGSTERKLRTMTERTIKLYIDNLVTGMWCPSCSKPAGIQVSVYRITAAGVTKVTDVRRCTDCKRPCP